MLALTPNQRHILWERTVERIETYFSTVRNLPVSPEMNPAKVRAFLEIFDFAAPVSPEAAVDVAVDGLTRWQVHTPHPRYFGLFNPAPTTMGIAADALVAAFNPQIAAWSHNPFAAETERHVVRAIAQRFGYDAQDTDGVFCSGGMEANHTALLTALTRHFSAFPEEGLRALKTQPVLYVSSESHHSFLKAARMCGIGMNSVRLVAVDDDLRMRVDELERAIAADRLAGFAPFFVGATAGTTSAGAVDPMKDIADVCRREMLWMHTDAAWGGGAVLLPELRSLMQGIELSDSITFDAHKWLSVPMGAGLYLTRHPEILSQTFGVQTAYMPKDAVGMDVVDPHLHSMQWSRRFIGLKVFLSLLVAGWDGYTAAIRHQTAMGALLKRGLIEAGWEIANNTPLPVICFCETGAGPERQRAIAAAVVSSGEAWISPTVISGRTVIRACVTHYGTTPEDVGALLATLDRFRNK
ncbi:MAG: aminotransferase class V-fold PLP-dependent enzyme [Bryobacteraceae bacterium]|nr:aminotransferase class V-fold PLP-dependent enzyme [Bryobacteraceae bacterium]